MDAEKIICCDGGNRGLEAAALMNGGMNNWNNNPFIYLVWMMFANRMWGNGEWGNVGNVQTAEIQAQLNALRNQMSDNQNSSLLMDGIKGNAAAINQLAQNLNCDFNTLNACCCDVRNGISQLGGQIGFSAERVINAVQMGDCNLIQALQNCCCQTQQSILKMGYEQQLATCQQTNQFMQRIDVLGNAMQQGFSQVAFQAQQDKCDLIRAGQDNTQRIVDVLNNHWNAELQQKYNDARMELSQQRQNAYLIAQLKTTSTTGSATA